MLEHPDLAKFVYYLIFGVIAVLATVSWFSIQRWITYVDHLQGSIDRLRETIEVWKLSLIHI